MVRNVPTIYTENTTDITTDMFNEKIIKDTDELSKLLLRQDDVSPAFKSRLEMKKEHRAKKNSGFKSSFVHSDFGVRPTKGRFEPKKKGGVAVYEEC